MAYGLYRPTDIQTALNAKQNILGYTPENEAYKETVALDSSIVKYPCNNVVKVALDGKLDLPSGTPDGTKFLRDDNSWQPVPSAGGAVWGSITGTLSAQTDLQTALNGKLDTPTGTPTGTKFLRDDDSWQPIPAASVAWGSITGTLSSQTDLQTALNAKVDSVSASSPLASSGGVTPTISITQANASTNGYLSSTDWNTFNNKQNALTNPVTGTGTNNEIAYFNTTGSTIGSLTTATYPSLTELSYVKGTTSAIQTQLNAKEPTLTKGNLTETVSGVLTITGGTSAVIGTGTTIQVKQASASASGYLSSTDWSTFNSKGNGTVTSVTGTSPIASSGGATPAISIADAVADGATKGAAAFTASDFNSTSGVISIDYTNGQAASGSTKGFLTSTDWTTFNSKEPALTKGNLTEATSSVLTITGGTGAVIGSGTSIQVKQANGSQSGFLATADWTTFNGKQAALVSGTNIKTVNSTSLLGSGDVAVQATLVSGTNIKTVNSTSLLGSGDVAVQATLVSGTNIKTSDGITLLGSGNQISNYTLQAMAALGSTIKAISVGCEGVIGAFGSGAALTNQRVTFTAVYLPQAATITGVKFFQVAQGNYTANNYNGVGLYTYSGGTMTLVASSTNDGNIWKGTANTWQTKAFSATYSASAGIYFIGHLYCQSAQTTAPTVAMFTNVNNNYSLFDFTNSAKLYGQVNTLTALPASQLMSGVTGYNTTTLLLLY